MISKTLCISRFGLTFALQGSNCEAKRPDKFWYVKFILFHSVRSNAYPQSQAGIRSSSIRERRTPKWIKRQR